MKVRTNGERVWEMRYYVAAAQGRLRRAEIVGSLSSFPNEATIRKSQRVQAILQRANEGNPQLIDRAATFGSALVRYEEEEMPERHITRTVYCSLIKNHIAPRWSAENLDAIKPLPVEQWLKGLSLAPKSKAHIRGIMSLVFKCALKRELTKSNPIELVRAKGGSKRLKRPPALTMAEFERVLQELREPYRTMAMVAGFLGLRISEVLGLKWADIDLSSKTVQIQRSVVEGRVGDVKTESSQDSLPIPPVLLKQLQTHRQQHGVSNEGWIFANPRTGRPYHQGQALKDHLKPAGERAKLSFGIGWHTFRHSYRSWLDDTGAPMSVQKELMRHADIQTTMNVYGRAVSERKRTAVLNVAKQFGVKTRRSGRKIATKKEIQTAATR